MRPDCTADATEIHEVIFVKHGMVVVSGKVKPHDHNYIGHPNVTTFTAAPCEGYVEIAVNGQQLLYLSASDARALADIILTASSQSVKEVA